MTLIIEDLSGFILPSSKNMSVGITTKTFNGPKPTASS